MATPPEKKKPQAKVAKLKDTCDACARSKVKCDRGRPTCRRCSRQGLVCHYSVAQRVGRSRTTLTSEAAVSKKACMQYSRTTQDDISWAFNFDAENIISVASPVGHQSGREQADRHDSLGMQDTDISGKLDFAVGTFNGCDDIGLYTSGLEVNGKEERRRSNAYDIPITAPPLGSTSSPQLSIAPSQLGLYDWNSQMESILQSNLSTTWPMPMDPLANSPMKTISTNLFNPDEGTDNRTEGCPNDSDCTKLALVTFESLHIPATSCMLPPFPKNYGKAPSMDAILKANKTAIENVFIILSCPCSSDEAMVLLLTLICNQVIEAYQRISLSQQSFACNAFDTSSESPTEQNITQTLAGEAISMDRDFDVPMTIGGYILDNDIKRRMIASVLLCELAKVGKAVERLNESSNRRNKMESNNDLETTLKSFLMTKLRATFRSVRDDLDDF